MRLSSADTGKRPDEAQESRAEGPGEQWRPVVGFEGYYEVSDQGRVRSLDRVVVEKGGMRRMRPGRIMKPVARATGHLCINLMVKGKIQCFRVHRLVLEAFGGPCPEGMECRHLNGNPQDNRPENLAWGTRRENQHDRWTHGTHNRGERHGLSKITEAQALAIREARASGEKLKDIAARFDVSSATVSMVARGLRWGHTMGRATDEETA